MSDHPYDPPEWAEEDQACRQPVFRNGVLRTCALTEAQHTNFSPEEKIFEEGRKLAAEYSRLLNRSMKVYAGFSALNDLLDDEFEETEAVYQPFSESLDRVADAYVLIRVQVDEARSRWAAHKLAHPSKST